MNNNMGVYTQHRNNYSKINRNEQWLFLPLLLLLVNFSAFLASASAAM